MLGLYFSGTGNTKHCVEMFVSHCDKESVTRSIKSPDALTELAAHDRIVFGYPVYFSNTPKIVRDYLTENGALFKNKKVFILATMGLWSGDGAGLSARLLKKHGAVIEGGLHLQMPDCIGDVKLLKKSLEANRRIVSQAGRKAVSAAKKLMAGKPTRDGLSPLHQFVGFLGQRYWCRHETATYRKKPDVRVEKCTGCGTCVRLCPMKNLSIQDGKAVSSDRCTMCYRCCGHCPEQALTILGKRVYEQCLLEHYL